MTLRLHRKMIGRMNKKGVDLISENIVYIILVVVVLGGMFFAVDNVGRQVTFYENVYAKQIALMIDKAEPGMEIEYRNFRMFSLAAKNNAPKNILDIDNRRNIVTVKLSSGKGYHYEFFNDVDVAWNIIHRNNTITLKIVENSGGLNNEAE